MTRNVRTPRFALMVITAIVLFAAGTAGATSCKADCEGTDCNGDCTVNAINCSTACLGDGCPGEVLCKEYGGESWECTHEFTKKCSKEEQTLPIPGPEQPFTAPGMLRSADWTVVAYEADDFAPMGRGNAHVLATSNQYHAERVVDELIVRQREDSSRMRQRVFREGLQVDRSRSQKRRLHYSVSSEAGCVKVTLDMEERQFGSEVPEQATVFVRATADSTGRIVAAELLHSDGAFGAESQMVEFLKRHGQLSRTDGGEGPYVAYIAFYSSTGGSAGWIVSGSKALL